MEKPHILYWKWNDDLLNKNIVRERTLDIINRSIFDVIYISLHSMKKENQIMCNSDTIDSITECASILKEHDRKMVLDLDISAETAYFKEHPLNDKSYLTKYCRVQLDKNGNYSEKFESVDGVFLCKALTFNDDDLFDEKTVVDLKEYVTIEDNTLTICAGEKFGGVDVVFYPKSLSARCDILGDEYKASWEEMCKKVANTGIKGIAADEWGAYISLEAPTGKQLGTDEVAEMSESEEFDLDTLPFFIEWFTISDGLCRYYKQKYNSDLKEDLLWFRCNSDDREKGIRIVNQYLNVLRTRVADGEQCLYDLSKKYFGDDSIVLCHPTWWGDELNSAFDVTTNAIDWWEVKKDFAQTDELILMPVRMSRTRRCSENLWYNMWYSMRTMDIKSYYTETWMNARYGGRTHYLGYECYEPGVVLCLNQKDYLEKCSEMEEKIEKLNTLQTSRPDSRILIVFGYEAVANWKICDPNEIRWNRVSDNIHNAWKFTKELFDSHYLCELVPSTEIDNGFVQVKNNNISYCGHEYDMLIYVLPEGMSENVEKLLNEYSKVNKNLIIVGNKTKLMSDKGLLNQCGFEIESVLNVLDDKNISRNCGENYCVYEDGSVLFTTDGKDNIGNALNIDETVCGMHIKFEGEDYLFVRPKKGEYEIAYGGGSEPSINRI